MKLKHIFILFLLTFAFIANSQDIPPRPNPPRLVNDFADVLTPRQEQALEQKLRYFNDTTSNQIAVVILKSLNGDDPAMMAIEIGEQWKVGQADFDNGIVVLVKPKYGNSDRGQANIAIGYGLEGAIPDAITKRIVDNEMIPFFRQDDYYSGIDAGTDVLMKMAAGEITADGYNKQADGSPVFSLLPFLAIIIIIFLMRSSRRRSNGIGRSGLPFWTALWLGSSMGRSHSGNWNNFTGGGSGSGGGGGFGGFGGGSFGGGGAGGSW